MLTTENLKGWDYGRWRGLLGGWIESLWVTEREMTSVLRFLELALLLVLAGVFCR